jgi:heat shock protein HspQ
LADVADVTNVSINCREDCVNKIKGAKYGLGDIVRHRLYPFRGIVFDIDPEFANTEEWWLSIPEALRKDQPYYHLLAENDETEYVAYVSEQNLLPDQSGRPLHHPKLLEMFAADGQGRYRLIGAERH